MLYPSGNVDALYDKVKVLLQKPELAMKMGQNAYQTMITEWNAEKAAERFVKLAESALEGTFQDNPFESGPCSKAGE